MTITEIAPIIVFIAFLAYVFNALREGQVGGWCVPAAVSAAFFVWTAVTVVQEGPFGFWANHTQDLWGNQVWFDLFFAVAIGWALILPRARAQGMRLVPWLLAIVATGCIGLLAMVARLFYLEDCSAKA